MKCPNCGLDLVRVVVTSYCTQVATLDAKGNAVSWDTPDVGDSLYANCINCDHQIPLSLIENGEEE